MIDTFSMVAGMKAWGSVCGSIAMMAMLRSSLLNAAARLRNSGDARGDLCRPFGKELVQLLNRHSRRLAQHPHSRSGSLLQILAAHEADDLPVPVSEIADALESGERRHHGLSPLLRVQEKPFVVTRYVGEIHRCGRHALLLI